MVSISIPEGYVLVRPRSVETATALLAAADKIKADRKFSVRTVQGGYHVLQAVAEEYQKSFPEAEIEADGIVESVDDDSTPESEDGAGTSDPDNDDDSNDENEDEDEELAPLPVTASSTHAEIDAYADSLDPKVTFPKDTNKPDKIALLEAARQPKNDDAE